MSFRIRPQSLSDGLIFYAADGSKGEGDFIGLALRDGALELLFDSGSGLGRVRSKTALAEGEWASVELGRKGKSGWLRVGGEPKVEDSSPDGTADLNLGDEFFVGGLWPGFLVAPAFPTSSPFDGCISNPITINGCSYLAHVSLSSLPPPLFQTRRWICWCSRRKRVE